MGKEQSNNKNKIIILVIGLLIIMGIAVTLFVLDQGQENNNTSNTNSTNTSSDSLDSKNGDSLDKSQIAIPLKIESITRIDIAGKLDGAYIDCQSQTKICSITMVLLGAPEDDRKRLSEKDLDANVFTVTPVDNAVDYISLREGFIVIKTKDGKQYESDRVDLRETSQVEGERPEIQVDDIYNVQFTFDKELFDKVDQISDIVVAGNILDPDPDDLDYTIDGVDPNQQVDQDNTNETDENNE